MKYFQQLQKLSFSYHDRILTGDLITLGILDIEGVRMFVNTGLEDVLFVNACQRRSLTHDAYRFISRFDLPFLCSHHCM